MRKAVYAGSFDPLTKGHYWMIEQGAEMFDKLVVAIGTNPEKRPVFSLEERVEMLKEATKGFKNTCIKTFEDQYLVNYAKSVGANYLLRGLRSEEDFAYEYKMRHFNGKQEPLVSTVFLMPPKELEDVSSSFVKGLIGPRGWEEVVKEYLPEGVYNKVLEKYKHGK
jgi:pantetheine-phosphate adenylyltransferase